MLRGFFPLWKLVYLVNLSPLTECLDVQKDRPPKANPESKASVRPGDRPEKRMDGPVRPFIGQGTAATITVNKGKRP